MAKKKTTKSAIPSWKKKKWYELIAPSIYSEKSLGETPATSPEGIIGRVVDVNMMNLVGNARKQNFTLKFRVVKVQGNKGLTKPIKLSMISSSVRRLIRSGKERVDASFVCETKDGIKLRVKPLIVTRGKTYNSTKADLQNKAKSFISDFAKKNSSDSVFDVATRNTLQKDMKNELDKVYPVKLVEIRGVEVELVKGERMLGDAVAEPKVTEEEVKEEKAE